MAHRRAPEGVAPWRCTGVRGRTLLSRGLPHAPPPPFPRGHVRRQHAERPNGVVLYDARRQLPSLHYHRISPHLPLPLVDRPKKDDLPLQLQYRHPSHPQQRLPLPA
ncbi:hypothetical protein BU14_0104s0013 [Porphyra umbilicalis]|uniref:Uncharacterized protein n=1 Tax=Porphyra umbilicalis TaxID=2786 RepID=A0A1X6PCJ6_PORUM|nr:hypothetical protein BU14_0104s0013 [Porphyra umbilicalis]|eukprot:OSX78639.1 hypothetical protein BU14_0104s0013 [Porphyra umbilicalis]